MAKILFFKVHFSASLIHLIDIEVLSIFFCKNQFVREVPLPNLMTLLSVSALVSVGTATAHSTVPPHNKMKKTREANERSSEELRKGLFSCLPVGGHSIFTWILFLPFLTAYLPRRGQSLIRTWTKIGVYWPPTHLNLSTSFLNDPTLPAGQLWSFTNNKSLVLDYFK